MGRGLRRREPGLHGRAPCRGAGNRAFFRRATFADASLQKRRGGGNVEKISGQAERSFFIKRTQPCVHAACFFRHVRKEKHTALFRSVRRIFRGIYEKEEGKIMALQAVTFFLPLFHFLGILFPIEMGSDLFLHILSYLLNRDTCHFGSSHPHKRPYLIV